MNIIKGGDFVIKSFKKVISLIVVAAFILSLVPVISFADVVIPGSGKAAAAKPWTGNNTPNASFKYAGLNDGVTRYTWSGISAKLTHASEMAYSDGSFGKPESDMIYLVRDNETRTTADITQPGSFFDVDLTQPTNRDKGTSDFAVEFSFAMTDSSDRIQILTPMYQNYSKVGPGTTDGWYPNYKVTISPTTANIYGTNVSLKKALDFNTWYNVTLVYEVCNSSDGSQGQGSYDCYVYINSELYAKSSTTNTIWGPRYVRVGSSNVGNSANSPVDNWVHYDNINSFVVDNADTFAPSKPTASTFASNNANVQIIENSIAVPKDYTVAELKAALTPSKNSDIVRYYNSDYSALKEDSESAIGTNVVIASLQNGVETTFANYNVGKFIKKYPDINAGTTTLPIGNKDSSAICSTSVVNEGIGGKAIDDKYLKFTDAAGGPYVYVNEAPANAGNRDVLEFSLYYPSGAQKMEMELGFFDGGSSWFANYFSIYSDGIYVNFTNSSTKVCTIEPDKWYNIAVVTPVPYTGAINEAGESLDSKIVEFYVNGELESEGSFGYSKSGFRHIRFRGNSTSGNDVTCYLDNIRVYSGDYEPKYDVKPAIGYKDGIDDNNISVKGATTVKELKEDITKADDTVIRVYSSLTSKTELTDDAVVQSGNVVVAAGKNDSEIERGYNYYTIDRVKKAIEVSTFVNGNKAKLFDADDVLSVSADFSNYTDADKYSVTMYTAQYRYGELVNVWADTDTANAGETKTLTCDFEEITDLENSSIKVILVDENLDPYIVPETMRYSDTQTKATLFIVGSSSTQSYDNPSYPIQGWGYFIDDYLNDSITVDNRACSGWTTDHFMYPDGVYTKQNGVTPYGTELLTTGGVKKVVGTEDRFRAWSNVVNDIKPGDYVVFMLGINDYGSGNVPSERFMESLTQMYTDTVSKGATFIPITLNIAGKDWDDTTGFSETHAFQSRKISAFANTNNLPYIPLGAEMLKTYYAMADEYLAENENASIREAYNYVRNYFHIYAEHGTPPTGWNDFGTRTTDDSGHFNPTGANEVAKMVAKLLAESNSPLGDYVILPQ